MAAEGAQVFATDVNPKLVATYGKVPNVTARVLDVLDDDAVAATIDELPPLDILFNCAGFVHNGTILDCTPKDWDFSFNLNVRAMYVTIRAALPKMLEKGGASIINMLVPGQTAEGTWPLVKVTNFGLPALMLDGRETESQRRFAMMRDHDASTPRRCAGSRVRRDRY